MEYGIKALWLLITAMAQITIAVAMASLVVIIIASVVKVLREQKKGDKKDE